MRVQGEDGGSIELGANSSLRNKKLDSAKRRSAAIKSVLAVAWPLFVALGITAFALASSEPGSPSLTSLAQEGSLKTIRGTVEVQGDLVTFVTDDDGKSWEVVNPEMLKGHEGHHVELNVHVYADKGTIHVHTVKKLENSKTSLAERVPGATSSHLIDISCGGGSI